LPRKTDSSNAADWLWIAEADLPMIRAAVQGEFSFGAARSKLAEVLEKVLKAELIHRGWRLEKTHDLDRLLEAMAQHGSAFCAEAEPLCDALAEFYFSNRYPGFDLDDPDWPLLRSQVELVAALLAAVQLGISKP
jgi:HEPN domain-containing protein